MALEDYYNLESSEDSGFPREMYRFDSDSFMTPYFWTSADISITYNSNVYTPIYIKRSQPELSRETRAQQLVITVARDNPLAQRWVNLIPPKPIFLTVFRLHDSDPTNANITFWQGKVRGVEFNGNEATFTAQPIDFAFTKTGLRNNFGPQCNHQTYDQGCTLNIDDWTITGTITNIEDAGLTFSAAEFNDLPPAQGGGAAPNGYYTSGILQVVSTGEMRMVTNHTSTLSKVTVLFPFENISIGSSVKLVTGDDHTFTTCNQKFSNLVNFLGFTFAPSDNLFKKNILRS